MQSLISQAGRPRRRVLILGGGFGGVYTAMRLAERLRPEDNVEVALVNREDYLVFQPLLPEVISGGIDLLHCISPLRRLCPQAVLYTRELEKIDLDGKFVTTSPSFSSAPLDISYTELVLALGTVNDFSAMPGVKEHGLPFKNLADALQLRNQIIHALEEAAIIQDPEKRLSLLTFVVAGGGFSGVEVAAEINDFVREAAREFGLDGQHGVRVVLVHPGDRILPELTEPLGLYAQRILQERGVEIRLHDRVAAATAEQIILKSGDRISGRTLVSTVPAAPHPLLAQLECEKEKGRVVTDSSLAVRGAEHVWAVGDCAVVPQADGTSSPPTAQFAVRQAEVAADNIVAKLRGQSERRVFAFSGLGKTGALGKRSAVAEVFGINISGVVAWFFWRALYWWKMPGLDRKVRVAVDWALDLVLPRDLAQLKIDPSQSFSMEHFEAGEFVFLQGDAGDKMYVITKGEVEVLVGPEQHVLKRLGAGEYFGEMAIFTGASRTASIRTATPVNAMSITRADFNLLVGHVPAIKDVFESEIKRRQAEMQKQDQ